MRKYRKTFEFFNTEEAARAFCNYQNATAAPYVRRKYPAHYTPWKSSSPNDPARFVAWYVY